MPVIVKRKTQDGPYVCNNIAMTGDWFDISSNIFLSLATSMTQVPMDSSTQLQFVLP